MTKRKLVQEETPIADTQQPVLSSPLFSPGLTERQQIALAMKLSGESSHGDANFSTPRPSKINKTNKHGESPLQIAAIKGDLKQVKLLIRQGAQVNTRDHAGWSPLHEAACKGYLEICRTLIKHGAQVNVHGYCDETPLHDAAFNNHPKIVALLLQHNANPLLKNKSGKIPVQIVDNEQIKEMLVKASLKSREKRPDEDEDPLASFTSQNKSGESSIEEEASTVVDASCTPAPVSTHIHASRPTLPKQLFKDSPTQNTEGEDKIVNEDASVEEEIKPPAVTVELPVNEEIKKEPCPEEETVVVCKEEVKEEEEEVIAEEESSPSYYKYSHMMPEPTCSTSITQNGPFTLYIARKKRPVKRAPLLESRSPPATRSRAGGKPVDNTEAQELKCLNEGRFLLKSAVVTPRKKWLHQHNTKRRHMGDIYELQRRGTPPEPACPAWITNSMLHTKKYLLQSSVVGKLDEEEEHPHTEHIPPVMKQEIDKMKHSNCLLSCKHTADKERLLQQHEQSMLRVRRQGLMKHPKPSACSLMLQQHSFEYAKKLQTVSYDVNNDQLLLVMGEKVIEKFDELAEQLYRRHKQEADTQYTTQRFAWVNKIHKHGLYDMPILGNLDLWVERVTVNKLKPLIEYYDECGGSDSDESTR